MSADLHGLPPIKVVGVGGGGCNAVNRMINEEVPGVEFVGVTLDPGSALSLRQFGTESDFFKSTGKIKNNLHVWQGAALAFPQGIYRQSGA